MGEEDVADKGRGGKKTSKSGQTWKLQLPEDGGELEEMKRADCKGVSGALMTPLEVRDKKGRK